VTKERALKEPLAIVGMACRLPGADGLDAFWKLIVQGDVAWGKLPESRFSRDLYFDPGTKGKVGRSYSELGAVISDRPVDIRSCPLTPDLLNRYDVAHHIFLEVASQACRDAGMDPFAMPPERRTGVYVGHTGGSTKIGDYVYSTRIEEAMQLLGEVQAAQSLLGSDVHAVAEEVTASIREHHPGRRGDENIDLVALGAAKIVQEALKLDGPYLVVDAACASSLQAMAIAARALLQGGIDQAIVGGASYCKSDSLVLFSAAQSVSNTGSCPFGKDADGLVTAEGYVALVIKTLSRAVADGDRIRAVIKGIGVASDGKGKSLWAPRQEGQKLAVERAYASRDDLARLDYIEAHATSTQVGDATELGALSALLAPHMKPGRQIPIGSVKANVGHTLETAGLASLVKVVLAMEHETIPPGSTARELNEDFDWQGGPFYVPRQSIAWPRKMDSSPRLAAVNAFGIGGLNVHVALADYVPSVLPASPQVSRSDADPDADAIAIVGMGAVFPGSLSVEAFYDRLDRGESALSRVPANRWRVSRALDPAGPRRWHTVADIGGFIEGFAYDWRRHKVPPKQIAAANPLQFMLLEAADAAIADAGGEAAGLDRARTGVVVGTMFGGEFANDLQIGLRLPETAVHLRAALWRRRLAEHDIDTLINAYEKKVLERLPALIDETGSFTSSTLASRLTKSFDLMGGALALDSGDCSSISAIAAAVDLLHDGQCDAVLCAAGQRAMDLMAFEGMSLDGLLARKPGSALSADTGGRVPGEGAAVLLLKRLSDARAAGNKIHGVIRGVALRSAESLDRALAMAIQDASEHSHMQPGAVRAIDVIATGSPEGDDIQLAQLARQYPNQPVAGALDSLTGHLGAAAGAASVIKLMRSLHQGEMPGTPGLSEAALRTTGINASSHPQPIPAVDDAGYRGAAVTVINGSLVGHIVVDNGKPIPASVLSRPSGTLPLPRVAKAAAKAKGRPLVAALFPGQGSQYTDMFRGLVEESTIARDCLASLDAMARRLGMETLAEIAWRPGNGLGTKVWDTQWGMFLADLLVWQTLQAEGFAPDFVASHSFGEFPSLAAVGAWSIEDGARATRARADAVEQFGPRNGVMLSVIADRATVAAAISAFSDKVWICAENAPEQAVIGGTVRAVDAVELLLEGQRVRSKRLAVPSPFHTPLLATAASQLATAIEPLVISVPSITTLSSTTAGPVADATSIRQSLIRQMTETVRWVSVIERLYQEGVRVFVEVGPSGVLSGLVRRILDDQTITVLQCDQRGRATGEHLTKVVEQLRVVGVIQEPTSTSASRPQVSAVPSSGRVLSFDATERRRTRNREGGVRPQPTTLHRSNGHESHGSNGANHGIAKGGIPATVSTSAGPTNRVAGYDPRTPRGLVMSESIQRHQPLSPESREAATPTPSILSGAASSGLQRFLIDFVVEQTGYPPEIVELDADLEADLGIDSIRKAQLFGEIGQKYGLTADDSVSLDDFRTLRHLLEYMLPRVGGSATTGTAASATDASRSNGKASGGHAANGHVTVESLTAVADTAVAEAGVEGNELEIFLINFVVEQTGYPPEIVELDADLEADLGIDSIRKAQLFGEIGQKYGLTADDSVSLDDFRTLRHLLEYMLPLVGGSATTGTRVSATDTSSLNGKASGGHAVNGHITVESLTAVADTAVKDSEVEGGELQTFLIDFVVEQTGYPRDIVELDVDLEADLGIDSIRKAQLFGEIGQKYGLTADDTVSLDDFRTLRHLLAYMLPRVGGQRESVATSGSTEAPAPQRTPRGDAFRRGVEAGRLHRDAVRLWARQVSAAERDLRPAEIDPHLLEYIEGVADGAAIGCDVLLTAFTAPAAALGGGDVIAVSSHRSGAGVRGMVVGFGRMADPSMERFAEVSRSGVLIGVKGLPGAVAGWNDSGLMVVLGRGDRSVAGVDRSASPAALLVERLVRECSSVEDVERLSGSLPSIAETIIVLHVNDGGVRRFDGEGRLELLGDVVRECDPRAALARILLADGAVSEQQAVASVLGKNLSGSLRSSLSAAGTWLAVGVVDGEPQIDGGSALGGSWLASEKLVSLPSTQSRREGGRGAITKRYGLVTQLLAQPLPVRNLTAERVAIIGGGELGIRLAQVLESYGANPVLLPDGDHRQLGQALDHAEAAGPIRHLVVATAWSGCGGSWVQRRGQSVVGPYFACQRWVMARSRSGGLAGATMTAVTNMGGDFGLSGTIGSVESGALTGLFKGVAREFPDLQVRVADFSPIAAVDDIAAAVVGAIRDDAGPIEIGHQGGKRVMIVPCEGGDRVEPTAPRAALTRGSVWLVTGGARGVTAACARELASRYGLTLAVVGSTQPVQVEPKWLALDEAGLKDLKSGVMLAAKARGDDPRHAWKVIEKSIEISKSMTALQAAGVNARYYACDLADSVAVRSMVRRVVAELGPVRGLVHGAGFEAACRFEKKTLEGLEATLGPKCIGFTNLLDCLDTSALERVVAFGSTSGRLGGHGQADYSLANDMLAKMACAAKSACSSLRATVFHWHAWDEVGMASRPESRFVLEQFGMKFMPLAEGVRRFIDEIEAGQPDVEVLVTEPMLASDADCGQVSSSSVVGDNRRSRDGGATHPHWGSLVADVHQIGEKRSVTFHLDPTSDRFLLEHLQYGRPLLPGVMGLELLAQAGIAAQFLTNVCELRDFSIDQPIGFSDDIPKDVKVDVLLSNGVIETKAFLQCDQPSSRSSDNDVPQLRGLLVPGSPEPISEQCSEPPFPFFPTNYRDDSPLRHGPTLQTLKGLFLDRSGGWARLTAVDENVVAQPRGARGWTVPVALLDGCVMACGIYSYVMCGQRTEIPRTIDRVRFFSKAADKEKCTARLYFRNQDAKTSIYDVVLFGADGRGILAVDGLRLAVMRAERS
jgi:acyl transferase domain-containing protein/acyl carrier protein/NAD(P)-dependent dehydrogenase (short-subunit alcohol dehydrogenase family)